MIAGYLLIIIKVLKAFFLNVTKSRKWDKKLYYASVYLFHKQSFQLPQSSGFDKLIILKCYIRAVKNLFYEDEGKRSLSEGPVAILDSSFSGMEDRIKYLEFYGIKTSYLFSRTDLRGNTGLASKFFGLALLTKLLFFFWPASFFKNRANYALLFKESIAWFNILNYCKTCGIKEMYIFSIYEKDSNFLTLLLQNRGIKVNKITSEVPINFANRIIITDGLFLCFNYQLEEVKMNSETLFYKHIETWMPEMQLKYLAAYDGKNLVLPTKTIGFYSGACWLRKKLDHTLLDVIGSYDVEESILRDLLEYIGNDPELRLIIFLHPLEKRTEQNKRSATSYYSSLINETMGSQVGFYPTEKQSVFAFDKINIGVSMFSTIMFERLSLGFKCILNPVDKPDFPIVNSPFRNICAYSKKDLFEKLDKNINLSMEEYLKENGIQSYVNSRVNINYSLN